MAAPATADRLPSSPPTPSPPEITEHIRNQGLEVQGASQLHSVLKLLEQTEVQILTTHLPANDPIRMAYERFRELDMQLFPIEMMAGLREKDIIETIRMSPRDAQKGFSRSGFSDKVAGDALYHFGGFFKRSWRSNDILWGRLDGLCQLVESLLQRDRLRHIGQEPNPACPDQTAAGRRFGSRQAVPAGRAHHARRPARVAGRALLR